MTALNEEFIDNPALVTGSTCHSNGKHSDALAVTATSEGPDGNDDLSHVQHLVRHHNVVSLKKLARFNDWSVDHVIRSNLWIELCALHSKGCPDETVIHMKRGIPLSPSQGLIDKTPIVVSSTSSSSQNASCKDQSAAKKLPAFIDVTYCRFFHLNGEGQKAVERIIWSLARDHPEMTFCPLIYPMTALFLHYMNPLTAFNCITRLIRANTPPSKSFARNKSTNGAANVSSNGASAVGSHFGSAMNGKTSHSSYNGNSSKKSNMMDIGSSTDSIRSLLPKSKGQISKDAFVLIKLSNSFYVSFWPQRGLIKKQREQLNKKNDIDPAILEWLKWIFIGLPFPHLVRIIDCFLVEGFKFLIRIGLALLVLYKRSNQRSQDNMTLDQMIAFCERISITPNQLIHLACSLSRLTSSKIVKQYRKAEDVVRRNPEMSGLTPQPSPAAIRRGDMIKSVDVQISSRVAPRTLKSAIIDWYLLDLLWEWIPDRIAVKEPVIVFSTNEDGCSLRTLFAKTDAYEPTILLIKTQEGDAFGAYCSESWSTRLQRDSGHYFGTGETFLFSLKPKAIRYPWSESVTDKRQSLSHSSQLFMTGTSSHIIIGSGNGSGIWLDEDLSRGKTERCDTFKNDPLARTKDFICSVVEVIAFL